MGQAFLDRGNRKHWREPSTFVCKRGDFARYVKLDFLWEIEDGEAWREETVSPNLNNLRQRGVPLPKYSAGQSKHDADALRDNLHGVARRAAHKQNARTLRALMLRIDVLCASLLISYLTIYFLL